MLIVWAPAGDRPTQLLQLVVIKQESLFSLEAQRAELRCCVGASGGWGWQIQGATGVTKVDLFCAFQFPLLGKKSEVIHVEIWFLLDSVYHRLADSDCVGSGLGDFQADLRYDYFVVYKFSISLRGTGRKQGLRAQDIVQMADPCMQTLKYTEQTAWFIAASC